MQVTSRLTVAVGAALALGGVALGQNSARVNLMPLNNGDNGVFALGATLAGLTPGNPDGIPTATLPSLVDGSTSGDGEQNEYVWRAYPKEVMNHPGSGTMEISSLQEFFWTDDWVGAGSNIWDTFIATGVTVAPSVLIRPDLTTAGNSVLILGGPGGFPAQACPPAGQIAGFEFVTVFSPNVVFSATGNTGYAAGDGIVVTADGTAASQLTFGHIQPGGLTIAGAPCGLGNASSMLTLSDDETQNDYHGGGFSEYGGANLHDGGNAFPDNEVAFLSNVTDTNHLGFFEPVLQPRGNTGLSAGTELGLGMLNPSVSAGTATYGYSLTSFGDIGKFGVVASSFTLLPFALNIFGADIVLNVGEPTVSATQKIGAITKLQWNPDTGAYAAADPNDTFNKGVFQSNPVLLPVSTPQIPINMQGVALQIVPTLAAVETNVVKVTFRP
jgi:hypothetical protein